MKALDNKLAILILGIASAASYYAYNLLTKIPVIAPRCALQGEFGLVTSLCFGGSQDVLYSVTLSADASRQIEKKKQGIVAKWNLRTGKSDAVSQLDRYPLAIVHADQAEKVIVGCGEVIFSRDPRNSSETIAELKRSGELIVLDANSLEVRQREQTKLGIFDIAVSPDEAFVAAVEGAQSGEVLLELRRVADLSLIHAVNLPGSLPALFTRSGAVNSIQFTSNGKFLAACAIQSHSANDSGGASHEGLADRALAGQEFPRQTSKLFILSVPDLEIVREVTIPTDARSFDLSFQLDLLLVLDDDHTAYIAEFLPESLENTTKVGPFKPVFASPALSALIESNSVCVIGCSYHYQRLQTNKYDVSGPMGDNNRTSPIVAKYTSNHSSGGVYSMAASTDGKQFAMGNERGTITVWPTK